MTTKQVTYYRCDRCKRNWRNDPHMRSIMYGGWDEYHCRRDLCPDCAHEFERFMDGAPLAAAEDDES